MRESIVIIQKTLISQHNVKFQLFIFNADKTSYIFVSVKD